MGFWFYILITTLILPALILFFGLNFSKKGAPKDIDGHSGFRSRRATKSWDAWVFTHKLAGRIWTLMGIIMLPVSVVIMLFSIKLPVELINIFGSFLFGIQGFAFVGSVIHIEMQIKKNFNDFGVRNPDSIEKELKLEEEKAAKALKKKEKSKKK